MMPAWGVCRQKTLLTMKKIFLLLIAAIANGMCLMAQDNRVATLQHESGIQAFYGENALSDAYNAAVDGDVITLSAGEFNGCIINKALTIRGEGMSKTKIKNDLSPVIPEGCKHPLTLEGLLISYPSNSSHTMTFSGKDGTEQVVITKCRFDLGNGANIGFKNCNATIIQSSSQNSAYALNGSHVTCINSILYSMRCQDGWFDSNGSFDAQNCIVTYPPNCIIRYSTVKNTIFSGGSYSLDETNKASHCLVMGNSTGFSDSWSVNSMDGVFADDYHLTESAAATYIGTDGTEVGIYGGMYPYDTTPDYPLVKKLDVVGSHKDGKLNIKINVE